MKSVLFIFKKVPFTAFIFYKGLLPIWNYIVSGIEYLYYVITDKETVKASNLIINDLKTQVNKGLSIHELLSFFGDFEWKSDPLHGFLDYKTKAKITLIKKTGDCDDFMGLFYTLLKNKYDVKQCYVYSEKDGHAMLIAKINDKYDIISNLNYVTGFDTIEEASKFFYGQQTYFHYKV